MKKYIESIEQSEGANLDFIKEEIKATEIKSVQKGIESISKIFSKTEETKVLDKVKLLEKSGKKYKRRIHICRHEEGEPCTVEEIQDPTLIKEVPLIL